jgi:hypothetical protein
MLKLFYLPPHPSSSINAHADQPHDGHSFAYQKGEKQYSCTLIWEKAREHRTYFCIALQKISAQDFLIGSENISS